MHDITINPEAAVKFSERDLLENKSGPKLCFRPLQDYAADFTWYTILDTPRSKKAPPPSGLSMAHTHLSVCLHLKNGGRIGPGKIALLEAIQTKGSIKAVARHLGMSSRRIWLLVQQINDALQQRAVSRPQGGWQNSAIVTPVGERVIDLYHSIENLTRTAAFQELQELARLTRRRPPDPKKRSDRAPGGPSCAA